VTTQKITTTLAFISLPVVGLLLTKKDTSRTFFFFCKKEEEEEFWGENSLQKKEREFPPRNKYNI